VVGIAQHRGRRSSGTVQIVEFANYFYGIRLYGDGKDK
jgi:hypothetical protein